MLILFSRQIGKHLSRVRMFVSQTFCEIGINPSIFFLAADGERKNLPFGKLIERFHIDLSSAHRLVANWPWRHSSDFETQAWNGVGFIRRASGRHRAARPP